MRKTTRINRKLLFTLTGIVCLCSQQMLAAMYKWVDEEGNTHYTQSPPPGDIEKQIIKPPPKIDAEYSQKQLENRKKLLDETRDSRLEASEQKKKEQEEMEGQRAACEKARARLASYQRPRVSIPGEDGKVTRATEEQRQAEIAKSNDLIKELCK